MTREVHRRDSQQSDRSSTGAPRLWLEELEPRIAPTVLTLSAFEGKTLDEVREMLDQFVVRGGDPTASLLPTAAVYVEGENTIPSNDIPLVAEDISAALSDGTTYLGFPAQNAQIEGRLATYTDVDVYAFDVEAGSTIMAFTQPEGNFLNPVAVIMDPLGNPLQASYSLGGEAFHVATVSGTYYLGIASYPAFSLNSVGTSGGRYDVDLIVVPRPDGFEPVTLFLDFNGTPGPQPGNLEYGSHNAWDLNSLDPVWGWPVAIYENAIPGMEAWMINEITWSAQFRYDLLNLPVTVVNSDMYPSGPPGDYTTAVITDWAYLYGTYRSGLAGIAAAPTGVFDHGNLEPNDGCLVFADEIALWTAGTPGGYEEIDAIAATIVHEAGHTFGFRHTYDPVSIMGYITDNTNLGLTYDLAPYSFWQYYPGEELFGLQHAPELAYYGFMSGTMFQEAESSLAGGPDNGDIPSAQMVSLQTLADGTAAGVSVLSSYMHDSPDTDVFAVPLPVGAQLDIEVFGPRYHYDQGLLADVELLTLNDDLSFDALGYKLDADSAITWTARHPGTYYLAVSSYADLDFNGINDIDEGPLAGSSLLGVTETTGDYNLTILGMELTAGTGAYTEADFGGDAGNNIPGAPAVGSATGAVTVAGNRGVWDVDYYAFTVEEGQTFRITAEAAPGSTLDPVIGLFGPNGGVETLLQVFDPQGHDITAGLTITDYMLTPLVGVPGVDPSTTLGPVSQAGVYYIALTGEGGEGYGAPYNLRLEPSGAGIPLLGVPHVTESLGNPTDYLLDYGQVGVGYPVTADMTVTNVGYAALDVTSVVSPDPPVSNDFGVLAVPLLPGDSTSLHVTFNPAAVGVLMGNVSINNSATPGPVLVALSGSGALGTPLLVEGQEWPVDGTLELGPSLNDGAGFSQSSSPVLLSNVGVGDLTINSVSTGTADFYDNFPALLPYVLTPGQSMAFDMTFDPTANGPLADTLTVTFAGGVPNATLNLAGFGMAPADVVSIGAGQPSSSFTYTEADGDIVQVSIRGNGAVADLGFNPAGDHLDFVALNWADARTNLVVDVRTAVGDGLADVGGIYGLGSQSLGRLDIEGNLQDLALHGSLGRADVDGTVTGDVFVQNGIQSFATGGDLGLPDSVFFAGDTIKRMTVGARGSGADLNADMVVAASFNRLIVDDAVNGTMYIEGNVNTIQVGGQLGASGTVEILGDLQRLTVGSRQAPANMAADLYVGHDLRGLQVYGEFSGNLFVGGETGRLSISGPATSDHITVLGNMDEVGDLDFFSVYAEMGSTLVVETDTVGNWGPPNTVIAIWDSLGVMVFGPDDDSAGGFDSLLSYAVGADDVYTVGVTSFPDFGFAGSPDVGHYTMTIEGATTAGIVLDAGSGHNDTLATAQDASIGYGLDLVGDVRQLAVGARTAPADLDTDLHVWADLGRTSVYGMLNGDVLVGGDAQGLTVTDDVNGDVTVMGELRQLALGTPQAPADLLGDVWVGQGLRTARIGGDIWGDVTALGNLNMLQAQLIHGHILVEGDLRMLRTTSLVVEALHPYDYYFQGGGLPDGTLIVGGRIGRLMGA